MSLSRVVRMCHFWTQNGPFVLNKVFLAQTIIITFIYLFSLFTVQNLKIISADPELWQCAIFGSKMIHLPPHSSKKNLGRGEGVELLILFSPHLPISLFHCANFFCAELWGIQSYEDAQFLGPFPQMRIFFRKPVNEPCFFHSCLSTCQKSKSGINLLVKYWPLKNTGISLAESHFWL